MPDFARRAELAYLRQELTAPAAALAEYARGLATKLPAPPEAAQTAGRLRERAEALAESVERLTGGPDAGTQRETRHDLRAAASFVIMSCEDIAEGTPPDALDPIRGELAETLTAARRVLELIDRVVSFNSGSSSLSAPERAMLAKLPQAVTLANRDAVQPGRLLLVDDNQYGRDLLARMLRQLGHEVEAVAGGRAAQARLTQGPPVDLLLLDVMMPDVTGPEVLAWLKADPALWAVPVIMVSALGDDDSVLACIAAGAEDYLTRPVRAELLRARIAGCLEKKRLRDREAGFQARIDGLVRAIFPPAVVEEWRATGAIRTRFRENVGVLFADVVGFTHFAERYRDDPGRVIELLQSLVERFELTAARHGVQKIKTVGDAFMGAAGLSEAAEETAAGTANPALALLSCALDLLADAAAHPAGWQVRVGVHVGPVVTGVLGKTQFGFDVWGHTVNAASRIEAHGRPGTVSLSEEAWAALDGLATGRPRYVDARGLGALRVWDFEAWAHEGG